jgi:serine protease inhibitor
MIHAMIPLLVVAIGAGPEGVAVKDLVSGNNQFAIDLYGQARARPGNLFFSPYSISSALAMTYAGAKGETAVEMAKTLRFPVEGETLHFGFAQLDTQINGGNEKRPFELSVANALWGQKGLSYRPEFLKLTERCYRAGMHPVDFAGDPEAARTLINSWVEERTHDKIKDLLGSSDVSRDTDLILTNAIYFKGAWTVPFNKFATKDEDFLSESKPVPVPMMHVTGQFGYLEDTTGGLQALSLPYAGKTLSMVVLLPRKADGLAGLESSLTSKKLDGWLTQLANQRVDVALPRFKLEYGMSLSQILASMGMPKAFTTGADFSGMTTDRRLYISAVIHKAFADVNEEGTEAAAATGVVMTRAMAVAPPKPPVVFRADHPFLFLIRDEATGSILFMGRVTKPKG